MEEEPEASEPPLVVREIPALELESQSLHHFEEIHRFISIFPRPIVGLKAYAAAIVDMDPSRVEYRDACFYDYILRCNAYALRELQVDRNAVEAARDYFRLALQLFAEVKEVCYNGVPASAVGSLAGSGAAVSLTDGAGMLQAQGNHHREDEDEDEEDEEHEEGNHRLKGTLLIPNTVEDGALTLLAITFSNWACVELVAKNISEAFALLELLQYFSPSADENSLLGYRVDMVSIINSGMLEIMRCNFPEAAHGFIRLIASLQERSEELKEQLEAREREQESPSGFISITEAAKLGSRKGSEMLASGTNQGPTTTNTNPEQSYGMRLSMSKPGATDGVDDGTSQATTSPVVDDELIHELWDIYMLQGLAYYGAGVADEHPCGEDAEVHYANAQHYFAQAGLSLEEDVPRSFVMQTLQEVSQRLSSVISEGKERAEKEAVAETASRKDSKKKAAGSGGGKGEGGKKKAKSQKSKHVVAAETHYSPPPIHSALRTYIRNNGLPIVPAMLYRLDDALRVLLPLTQCEHFVSPLCGAQADEHYYVIAAMMPCETPLQWAIEVAARNKGKQRPSVWLPRVSLPGYLKPTIPDVSEGTSKVKFPKPMVRLLMPKPLPQSQLDQAEQGVSAALKLLTNRLVTLIKVEKTFEERWTATERIKNALNAYYVPQMLLRWKEKRVEERNFKIIQEDHAARILQQFFRLVVEVKPRQYGFRSAGERREQEQHEAAIVLQKYARRWIAKREREFRESLRAERKRRITVIQNLWRRLKAIRYVEGLREQRRLANEEEHKRMLREFSAIQIQSNYRRHLTQLLIWQFTGQEMRALKHHLRDSRHYYATQIQRIARGMLTRNVYGKAVYAKRCYGRNIYWSRMYNAACVQIQRIFRGWRTRQITRAGMVSCAKRIEDRRRSAKEEVVAVIAAKKEERDERLDAAAAKIQSLVRMVHGKQEVQRRMREREERIEVRQGYVPPPFSLRDCEY